MKPFLESNKPEFKRGDCVYIKPLEIVKKELEIYQFHFQWGLGMFMYCGKKAVITDTHNTCEGIRYTLNIDNGYFAWHKTMFNYNVARRFVENE